MGAVAQTIITVVVTAIVTSTIAYVVTIRGQINSVKMGLRSLLRAEIICQHDKYIKKGTCPIYAKEELEKTYIAYHGLGGNGTGTKMYQEVMALPEEPKKSE